MRRLILGILVGVFSGVALTVVLGMAFDLFHPLSLVVAAVYGGYEGATYILVAPRGDNPNGCDDDDDDLPPPPKPQPPGPRDGRAADRPSLRAVREMTHRRPVTPTSLSHKRKAPPVR